MTRSSTTSANNTCSCGCGQKVRFAKKRMSNWAAEATDTVATLRSLSLPLVAGDPEATQKIETLIDLGDHFVSTFYESSTARSSRHHPSTSAGSFDAWQKTAGRIASSHVRQVSGAERLQPDDLNARSMDKPGAVKDRCFCGCGRKLKRMDRVFSESGAEALVRVEVLRRVADSGGHRQPPRSTTASATSRCSSDSHTASNDHRPEQMVRHSHGGSPPGRPAPMRYSKASAQHAPETDFVRHRTAMAAAVITVTACLGASGCDSGDEVARYCEYGAVSQPQLDGCKDHVGNDQVDRLDTNAARYARGDLDRCLADAGPFCRD